MSRCIDSRRSQGPVVAAGVALVLVWAAPAAAQTLTLWHSWQQVEAEALEAATHAFAQGHGVEVEIKGFSSFQGLEEALAGAAPGGPDVVVGPTRLTDLLLEKGLIDRLCGPDPCPACEGPSPPLWCPYATTPGSGVVSGDFRVAGLCTQDGCAPCLSADPPRWCLAAFDRIPIVDLFQAGALDPQTLHPAGVPIAWNGAQIAIDVDFFKQQPELIPDTVDALLSLAEKVPWRVAVDPAVWLFDPTPTPLIEILAGLAKGDPSPQPSLSFGPAKADPSPDPERPAVWILTPRTLAEIRAEGLQSLVPIALHDLQAEAVVVSAFVHAATREGKLARQLVGSLAEGTPPELAAAGSTWAPANGGAWGTIADPELAWAGQSALLDVLGELRDFDIRGFIERPVIVDDFGTGVCAPAARRVLAQLSRLARTEGERVVATHSAYSFVRLCNRYLPAYDGAPCPSAGQEAFAECLADGYPSSGLIEACTEAGAAVAASCSP